jgi:hypothetical protein
MMRPLFGCALLGAWLLLGGLLGAGPPQKITLTSGQVIEGDIVKSTAESCFVETANGLRVLPKSAILKVEAGSAAPEPVRPPAPRPAEKSADAPRPAPDGPPAPGKEKDRVGPSRKPAEEAGRSQPDTRLDAARDGGPAPVLEITIKGSLDGKPLSPVDPFTVARLSYFFGEMSRPRFQVLPPAELRPERASASGRPPAPSPRSPAAGPRAEDSPPPGRKTGSGKAGPAGPGPEYRAEVTGEARIVELSFFNAPVLKVFRGRVFLRLVRLSDKKVVDELEVVEDMDADPEKREELMRMAYNRAVESLLKKLAELRTFHG